MHSKTGIGPLGKVFLYLSGTINGWCDDTEKIALQKGCLKVLNVFA